jgi:radical SAM protein with 4Fe4S-binding SPASM domain
MQTINCSTRPRTVFLEILYGCNLYCSYCYIGQNQNHTKPFVSSIENLSRILGVLKNWDIEEIVLLGGEPTLHPRFDEICRSIAELGFPHRGVVTNGTAMTLEKAKLLQESGFWVDISFRGPDSNTFDSIAGKTGTFQKVFNAASMLSDLGIPIGIEFDCIPQNHDGLYETISMLLREGVRVKQLQLHRILPEGDAKNNMEKFFLNPDQWLILFDQAARIRDELGIPVAFEDGFPLCLVRPEHWDLITPCACGFTLLTVSPTGDARYCSCHGEVLGNVLRNSLNEIWRRDLEVYRAPSRHYSACLECDLFDVCRGGCSASGHTKMTEGMDIFHEHFKPIKLENGVKPEAKLIMGQSLLSSGS